MSIQGPFYRSRKLLHVCIYPKYDIHKANHTVPGHGALQILLTINFHTKHHLLWLFCHFENNTDFCKQLSDEYLCKKWLTYLVKTVVWAETWPEWGISIEYLLYFLHLCTNEDTIRLLNFSWVNLQYWNKNKTIIKDNPRTQALYKCNCKSHSKGFTCEAFGKL